MVRLGYDGEMSIITEGVYVGRYRAARNLDFLKAHGITHIVNCAASSCESMHPSYFTYLNLPLKDEPASEDALHLPMTPLARFIPGAAFFIQDCLDSGGRVMVHCRKGISRSVSIVAGFLMFERGASLVEALTLVRKRRKVADPNVWFVEDLKAYQTRLEADRFNRFRARPLPAAIRPDADDADSVAVAEAEAETDADAETGATEQERAREALRRELQSAREALADAGAAARVQHQLQRQLLQQQNEEEEEEGEEPVRPAAARAPVAPVYMDMNL